MKLKNFYYLFLKSGVEIYGSFRMVVPKTTALAGAVMGGDGSLGGRESERERRAGELGGENVKNKSYL